MFPVTYPRKYHRGSNAYAGVVARVLVLAGTTEATELAARLTADGVEVISSLAGITQSPVARAGSVRSGGFGGPDGLAHYLTASRIDVLVDATHPHAAVMPFNAAIAAQRVGIPRCRLLRPAWEAVDGDHWVTVADTHAAAAVLTDLAATRVFLTVGRSTASHFAKCRNVAFVVRAIEPIGDVLPGAEVVLQRGPFSLEDEREVLRTRRIDTVVAKNAGGSATAAKLVAARELGVRVVMIERPAQPDSFTATTVDEAIAWLHSLGVLATDS